MEGVMSTGTATRGVSLLRAALLVTTGLILSIGSPAWARVGVTSGADGDPLGKPPNENERVLRIGIDVQANELITTAANDRAHLVFLDGSSLTVGPNARLAIDRFVYDPNTQKGELAINASKGVLRLVGGKISKSNAITITTPASTIGIRGGITILSVTEVETIARFVFGTSMTVTAGGQTLTAIRAGTQVTSYAGSASSVMTLFKPGSLNAALSALEGGSSNNNNSADQSAQSSGFSGKNSGQPSSNTPNFNPNQNGPPNTTNNTLTNTVSNTNPASQPVGNSTPQNQNTPTTTTPTITTSTTTTPPTTTTPTTTTPTTTTPTTTTPTTNNNNPPPSGPTRTSQTLTGYAGGLVVIDQPGGEGSRRVSLSLLQPGTVSITTDAVKNQAKGTIVVGLNASHQTATATLQLGGAGHSTFLNDKSYSMTNDPAHPSTLRIGDRTYPLNASSALVSASSPATCTCEFLSFGVWASSGTSPRNDGTTATALGTYVAGKVPTVQLPTMGSATYNGFMAGFASNNGQISPASGTYQNVWNFQARSGVFNGSFDNRSYSGTTQATGGPGGTTFAGNFNSTGGGYNRSGTLNGGFFSSPTDAAAYQAGTFSIGNAYSRYKATGVFAGQR
jgi:FecR protein